MNFKQIIYEALTPGMKAEKVPSGKKYLLLLDIDDTLLTANNVFIHRKLPTDKKVIKLTPEEYAKEKVTLETRRYYTYDEFRDPDKVYKSITSGTPLWRNLRIMDHHVSLGWEIGILTARGLEDVIYKALSKWLKFKPIPSKGKTTKPTDLQSAAKLLSRSLVYAINDKMKLQAGIYKGATDFKRKANVVKKLSEKYDKVKFLDDDSKNIEAINDLDLENVIAVKAISKEKM